MASESESTNVATHECWDNTSAEVKATPVHVLKIIYLLVHVDGELRLDA